MKKPGIKKRLTLTKETLALLQGVVTGGASHIANCKPTTNQTDTCQLCPTSNLGTCYTCTTNSFSCP